MRRSLEKSSYEELSDAALSLGLACRGGFHPLPEDGVPAMRDGTLAKTLVLLGFTGGHQWPMFAGSAEYRDGQPHPLDRWSRRNIGDLSTRFGASDLYPAPGPPWWPFQRWAQRAEALYVSPLGILIHPKYGLWHAYRGALVFGTHFAVPERQAWPHPCESCAARPCLRSCPAGAVTAGQFDHATCAAHIASPQGKDCLSVGCLARLSCPVGASYRYSETQSSFHMKSLACVGAKSKSDSAAGSRKT
jgi:hypothetical protein